MFRSTPPFIPQFRPLALDPLGTLVPEGTQERGDQEGIDSEAEKECSMFKVQCSEFPMAYRLVLILTPLPHNYCPTSPISLLTRLLRPKPITNRPPTGGAFLRLASFE